MRRTSTEFGITSPTFSSNSKMSCRLIFRSTRHKTASSSSGCWQTTRTCWKNTSWPNKTRYCIGPKLTAWKSSAQTWTIQSNISRTRKGSWNNRSMSWTRKKCRFTAKGRSQSSWAMSWGKKTNSSKKMCSLFSKKMMSWSSKSRSSNERLICSDRICSKGKAARLDTYPIAM